MVRVGIVWGGCMGVEPPDNANPGLGGLGG